jgi:NADPH:quinone reductase-like Zn-dependent oxidoreductase
VLLATGKFNTQIVFGARIMATHAQYVVLEEMLLTLKPAALPVEDAAACPTSITTAFQSLSKVVCKYDQESIVINGASGGVGSYLVLLAKHYFKYNHIIAVCSGKNADYVKSLGADRVIDYTTQGDYVTLLAQEKKQVIAVASTVGEYASHPQAILKSARQGGCFLAIAGPPYLEEGGIWNMVCFGCSSLVNKLWSLFNYPMYHFIMAEAAGEELDKLGKWMADNKMYGKIKLTKVSINEAPKAYNQIRSKRTAGKLVFTINNNE